MPTPEMELGQLRAELVGLHRHLRALAGRWDDRARTTGQETALCAGELRDLLDCTPTYPMGGFDRPIPRSSCGAVLVGLSAEEATANLHANAAAIGRAFPAPIPGLNWAFKAAADAEAEAERERRALEPLAERPPVEYVGSGYLRRCAHCDYRQITPVGVTAEAQHICQRDGVTYLIMWPRG